jgi:hypothetical protein
MAKNGQRVKILAHMLQMVEDEDDILEIIDMNRTIQANIINDNLVINYGTDRYCITSSLATNSQ